MSGSLFDEPSAMPAGAGDWFTAHCDGGSRGNPGPSGYGAVVEDAGGQVVARLSGYLGRQTNNFAEYSGLLAVLNWALEHGHKRLRVVSDSELMVKQMQGKYKVGSPGLLPLWQDARRLAARLERFEMRHTLRGGNQEADRLANEAMDKGMGKTAGAASAVGGVSGAKGSTGAPGRQAAPPAQARPPRLVLEGYVKDGVVHLLGGELPDGVFVKVIRE